MLEAGVEPLAGALELVHADHPEVEARTHVLRGSPGSALPALAGNASLLVLGHRGRGGFAGMLLGSVALRILARARCPVAVARGARREMNRALVGIDVDDVTRGCTAGAVQGRKALPPTFRSRSIGTFAVIARWVRPAPSALSSGPIRPRTTSTALVSS